MASNSKYETILFTPAKTSTQLTDSEIRRLEDSTEDLLYRIYDATSPSEPTERAAWQPVARTCTLALIQTLKDRRSDDSLEADAWADETLEAIGVEQLTELTAITNKEEMDRAIRDTAKKIIDSRLIGRGITILFEGQLGQLQIV